MSTWLSFAESVSGGRRVTMRVHQECPVGDTLGSLLRGCRARLTAAMDEVAAAGATSRSTGPLGYADHGIACTGDSGECVVIVRGPALGELTMGLPDVDRWVGIAADPGFCAMCQVTRPCR